MALTVRQRMQRIRQRDTAPEMAVRKYLFRQGVRYRVCPPTVPGRPDLLNKSAQWAVFVHGCFWHGHTGCILARLPKTNRPFWREKIIANQARDRRKARELSRLGYVVYTLWQCEIGDPKRLGALAKALRRAGRAT